MIQRDDFLESILNRSAYKFNEFSDRIDLKFLQDKNYNPRGSFFYTKVDCSNVSTLRVFENSGFKIIEENNCHPISINEGFQIADFISIHLPLNQETKNLINLKSFQEMKNSCVIVNTARGGIINEKDLYDALVKSKIRAAGLDVFEQEPPPIDHPLFALPNILVTPHNAALSLECRKRMAIEVCETVSFYLKDKEKLNIQNIINRKELGI